MLKDIDKRRISKEIMKWNEKNEEALQVISFTVIDHLQGPIHYGITTQGAWDELHKVHAPNDKQRKYSLIRRLYHLEMRAGSLLMDHKSIFDNLVQNLTAIDKNINPEELIILYTNSLPVETFDNWIQGQIVFIDHMSITISKGTFEKKPDA